VPTLYRNGRVRAAGIRDPTAIIVDGRTVAWVGDPDELDSIGTLTVVDLDGAWVTTAFVDAHVHATATGLALSGLDLSSAPTLADALAAVERAARAAGGRPILGAGWDETSWPEQRPPTARELDRAAYGGAVYLSRVDAHSAVISSALAAAVPGLAALAGYGPDGWLTRDAHDAARTAAFATLSDRHREELQRTALRHAASLGIASVHEMAGPAISSADDLAGLFALAADEPLPEVIGYWGELFGIATAQELGAVGAAGDLFCDGSLGSHTAALHQPYADRPDTIGSLRFDIGDLTEHIVQCHGARLQAGFHVIGDAAVDQALDAFEAASARLGRPAGAGSRLEHVEYVHDPARLAASGLVASMQPVFDATWGGPERMYAARLGSRADRLNRFADLAAAGVPLAFGSDAPVTPLGPWPAIWAAVAPSDPTAGIPFEAAFAAHTVGGWRAAGRTGGVIEAGAPATIAIWSHEPAPGETPRCLATLRDGQTVHDAGLLS
jgi:predicted amidohydrolase YtcJ